ncbi:MAG: hypothetical protein ABEI75_03635 [Halobaculum sp.]
MTDDDPSAVDGGSNTEVNDSEAADDTHDKADGTSDTTDHSSDRADHPSDTTHHPSDTVDGQRMAATLRRRRLAVNDTVEALCNALAAGDAPEADAALAAREADELAATLRALVAIHDGRRPPTATDLSCQADLSDGSDALDKAESSDHGESPDNAESSDHADPPVPHDHGDRRGPRTPDPN